MEVSEQAVGAMQAYLRLKRYILPSGIAREALQAAIPLLPSPYLKTGATAESLEDQLANERRSATELYAARELALEEGDLQELLERLDAGLDYEGELETENDHIELFNVEAAQDLFADAAAAIRALSSPDHADAGKVEGDGWSMSPPKFHRYPYFVENISGKWCLCKHHGNGASHTISLHETAREARDAAPASEGAE